MDRIIAFLLMTSLMLNFQNFDKNIYETQTISADIDKSSQIIDFSQTYNIHGEDVTFNFTASLNCCLPHICKYGGKRASFYVEILDSSTSSDVAYLNSPSQEYLKLSEINVKISKNDDIFFSTQNLNFNNIENAWNKEIFDLSIPIEIISHLYSDKEKLIFIKNDYLSSALISFSPTSYIGEDSYAENIASTESGYLPRNCFLQNTGSRYGFDISYIDLLGLEQTNRMIVTFEYTLINSYDYTDSYKGSYTTCIDLIVK